MKKISWFYYSILFGICVPWLTNRNLHARKIFFLSQADGGYVRASIGLINDFHISQKHIWDNFEAKIFEWNIFSINHSGNKSNANSNDFVPFQGGACNENMFVKEYTIFHRFNHFIWVDYQVASQPIWRPVKSCCQSSGLVTRDTGPDRIVATHCYKQTRSARIPRVLHIPT